METIEEKAKAYDEALKRARQKIDAGLFTEDDLSYIFPALRESEDERSRKWILEFLYDGLQKADPQFKEQFKTSIAYLEKQKEQKPKIKYVYPKFKKGDVIEPITPNGHYVPVRVVGIWDGSYSCRSDDGKAYLSLPIKHEDEYRLVEQKPNFELIKQAWYMEGYKDRDFETEPRWIIKTDEGGPEYELNPKYGQPLTKMQKPISFDESYNPGDYEVVVEGNATSLRRKEQKPVELNEKDEELKDYVYEAVLERYSDRELLKYLDPKIISEKMELRRKIFNFVRNLDPSWKPSEEQMKGLKFFLDFHRSQRNAGTTNWQEYDAVESLYVQLKKL